MCDFSLEMYRTRPAREGEKYVSTRFASGTIGLTAIGDNSMVVCVQCDTQLELEGLPKEVQETLGVGPKEEVTFVRLEHGPFRDGVRFKNGKELSLQQLKPVHARHLQVRDHDAWLPRLHTLKRLHAVSCGICAISPPRNQLREPGQSVYFIFND